MKFRTVAAAAMAALVISACGSTEQARPAATPIPIPKPAPTLAAAIQGATDLGPATRATTVSLNFGLSTPAPAPSLVNRAVAYLEAIGFDARWRSPSSLIAADGPAPVAASMLNVDFETYRLANGSTFYASLDKPVLPPALATVASGVSGLDNYRRSHGYAIRPGGMTPADVLAYYNIKALRDAGFDGKGQTIVLPEIDELPNTNDLNKFAAKYGLPPFEGVLTLKHDASWGTPMKQEGETVLDLEIIHAIAPAAQMVVYFSAPDFGHSDRAFDQMVSDHLGSIISESLGSCEADTPSGARDVYASIQDRAVSLGMSHFVASGDSGAFTCGFDQPPAGSFPSTLPTVTAVGGTSVFESKEGIYFKEYAWGSPLDQSGGGGGASQFYTIPDYQKNVAQSLGKGQRQVPDVAAAGDPSTGFHIVFKGRDGQAGGTSASTPLWAAVIALINQDLKQKGLREVGFANPALYWMGENSSKLNPKPFHDVTAGNILGYTAGSGWDFATGWGSMDAAGLAASWERYIRSGGG